MTGRSLLMAKNLKKFLLESFSAEEIKTFNVINVGAHDGWLLNQISDLGFLSLVALELRREKIYRGKQIRAHFNIRDKVEFVEGTLEQVKDLKFDIVVCTGVLYHVTSIPDFLRDLSSITRRAIYLESRIIDFRLPKKIRKQITPDNISNDVQSEVHLHALKGETS